MNMNWNMLEFQGKILDITETLVAMKNHGIDSFKAKFKTIVLASKTNISEEDTEILHAMIKAKYPSVEHLIVEPVAQVEQNVPRCPTCGSTNLVKYGAGARAISGFVFGRLSVEGRAQWQCKNCNHMW